ncbi:hypothetical protein AMK30_03880 [Streptomyces sp. CB02460]|nr:hypothetical protein AMK30_03880 [Streptomyces sp. CB02460]
MPCRRRPGAPALRAVRERRAIASIVVRSGWATALASQAASVVGDVVRAAASSVQRRGTSARVRGSGRTTAAAGCSGFMFKQTGGAPGIHRIGVRRCVPGPPGSP